MYSESAKAFGLVFICAGAFMLAAGLFLFVRQYRFLEKAVTAPGVVIGLRTSKDEDGADMYAPVVRFRTQTGTEQIYQSNLYSRPTKFREGDNVEVRYDPLKPQDAQVKDRAMNYIPAIIVSGLGVTFLVAGSLVRVFGSPK